ncbi:hypothetical protein PWT90_01964 [Aphanocladium album]|nr:hypothetical protein PWT90_01964 [Aphanocladium album]
MIAKAQPFEFISVSGTNIKGDAATRKRVRSKAQADYRQKNAPAPKPALKDKFDVGEWLQVVSHDASGIKSRQCAYSRSQTPPSTSSEGAISRSPSPFERSGSDVFQLMSPAERKRAQMLWQHLFKSMVEIGFLDLLQGSAALTQMLSSSAWHMNNAEGEDSGSEVDYARYSVMATNSLRHMLSEPSKRVTIETVVAILTFAAYANLTSDPKLVNIHLDGLCHALSYVGGLPVLDSLPVIRTMIYWIDLRASFLQDVEPRFPQPADILAQRSEILPLNTAGLIITLPDDAQVFLISEDLKRLNIILKRRLAAEGDELWRNVLFPQFNLAPILHNLLFMPRAAATDNASAHSRELFRLASILYLCKLWSRFGMDLTGDVVYVSKLQAAWTQHDFFNTWCFDHSLLLWTILVFCTYNRTPEQMRQECSGFLQEHVAIEDTSTERTPAAISRSLWCEVALGSLDTILLDNEAR